MFLVEMTKALLFVGPTARNRVSELHSHMRDRNYLVCGRSRSFLKFYSNLPFWAMKLIHLGESVKVEA